MKLSESRRLRTPATLALAAATTLVFHQVHGFDFINYDDDVLLRDNAHVNTGLLLAFLYEATGQYWRSAFVAALFALHPLHVEPVA